jgi:hypothetical protein
MNLFYTWGAIPYAAGVVYDRTESYAIVFSAITVAQGLGGPRTRGSSKD